MFITISLRVTPFQTRGRWFLGWGHFSNSSRTHRLTGLAVLEQAAQVHSSFRNSWPPLSWLLGGRWQELSYVWRLGAGGGSSRSGQLFGRHVQFPFLGCSVEFIKSWRLDWRTVERSAPSEPSLWHLEKFTRRTVRVTAARKHWQKWSTTQHSNRDVQRALFEIIARSRANQHAARAPLPCAPLPQVARCVTWALTCLRAECKAAFASVLRGKLTVTCYMCIDQLSNTDVIFSLIW